jgi:hypothetical protein
MRAATLVAIVVLAGCGGQNASIAARTDTLDFGDVTPGDTVQGALLVPRVVSNRTVIVFWLAAADTFPPDDQAEALDELNFATERIAPALARQSILLVPTNSDTIYVALANRERHMIVLTGVDYPFGYVFVDPGTAERVLAGVYDADELLAELEAYFDLPPVTDSAAVGPRIST